jgi:hypothetical protein
MLRSNARNARFISHFRRFLSKSDMNVALRWLPESLLRNMSN